MAKQTINVGSAPNDGTGDQLRDALIKVNENFDELYNFKIKNIAPTLPHGEAGDLAGMIAFDVDYLYVCVADYVDNATIIWKRINLPVPGSPTAW